MARHRIPKQRRAHRALVAAAAVVGISSTLVLGHAINQTAANLDLELVNTVLGLGGRGDPLSARVPDKLSRKIDEGFTVPAPGTYQGIPYPADFNFEGSTNDGIPKLKAAIDNAPEGHVRVVAYSEGTLVAEAVKRMYAADTASAPAADDLSFLFVASPYLPNGGLFGRFPGFRIPGLVPEFSPAAATPYEQTFVTNEYDTYADFPAYFNPLSIANALLGIRYSHPDEFYDDVDPDNLPAGSRVTHVPKANGGTDTYILVYAQHLPLLAPIREVAGLLMLTPITEPLLAAIEPVLRLAVDAGYTDRTYAQPAVPTPFSFFTPPAKILEAATGVPGALQQGLTDAAAAGRTSLNQQREQSFSVASTPRTGESELRLAPEHIQTPGPVETSRHVEKAEAVEKTEPVEKSTAPDDDATTPITHPTVTSDGNIARPSTVIGGAAPAAAGSTGLPAEQGDSPTGSAVNAGTRTDAGAPPAGDADHSGAGDEAA